MSGPVDVATWLASLLLAVVVVALVLRDLRRSTRPRALLAAGRLAEARAAAETLATSWMRILPGVREGAAYVVAVTRHLEGDLEGALDALERVRGRDLRYAVRSLEAATLVLAERDPSRALGAIDEARALSAHAEDAFIAAHALRSLGREAEADALATSAEGEPRHATTGPLAAAGDFFRGFYFARAGDPPRAREALEAARAAAPGTIYARRADALLAGAPREPDDDDDERSSLAPQVLGTKPSRPPPS